MQVVFLGTVHASPRDGESAVDVAVYDRGATHQHVLKAHKELGRTEQYTAILYEEETVIGTAGAVVYNADAEARVLGQTVILISDLKASTSVVV